MAECTFPNLLAPLLYAAFKRNSLNALILFLLLPHKAIPSLFILDHFCHD